MPEYFKLETKTEGLLLDCMAIRPKGEIAAVLQIVHGMSEYKERYLPLMEYLSQFGIFCHIADMRGHGKSILSENDLGYFYGDTMEETINDVLRLAEHIKEENRDKPFFLMGHSMGSLIVRSFVKRHDDMVDRLVVSGSPSDNPVKTMGLSLVKFLTRFKGERYISPLCEKLFTGGFNKAFEGEGHKCAWLSVNEKNVEDYEADPLCGFPFTLNGYGVLMNILTDVYSPNGWQMKNKAMPVWFASGENDPCMTNEKSFLAAVDSMKNAGYKNIDHTLYPDMRHEIFNETQREIVYNDLKNFLTGGIEA